MDSQKISDLPFVFGAIGKEITRVVAAEASALRSELEHKFQAELTLKTSEFQARELLLLRNVDSVQLQMRDLRAKHEKEFADLRADFARRTARLKDVHAQEIKEHRAEAAKLRETVEQQTGLIADQIDQIAKISDQKVEAEISCGKFRKKSISLELEILGLRQKLASARDELQTATGRVAVLQASEVTSAEKLRIANWEIDRLRTDVRQLSVKLGNSFAENENLKLLIAGLRSKLESQNADLQRELRNLGERNRQLNLRLVQAAEWGGRIAAELQLVRQNLQNPELLKLHADMLVTVIKNLLGCLQSQESEISSLAQKNADLIDQLDATERELKLERQLLPVMHTPVVFMSS